MSESTTRYRWWQKLFLYALLVVMAVIVLYPMYQAFVTSVATEADVSTYPPKIIPQNFNTLNYEEANDRAPLVRYLFNSFVTSGMVTLSHLILASLAGYAFAFMDFKFKNFFFLLFLSTMMIPWEATIIQNFLTVTTRNPLPFCSDNAVPPDHRRPAGASGARHAGDL